MKWIISMIEMIKNGDLIISEYYFRFLLKDGSRWTEGSIINSECNRLDYYSDRFQHILKKAEEKTGDFIVPNFVLSCDRPDWDWEGSIRERYSLNFIPDLDDNEINLTATSYISYNKFKEIPNMAIKRNDKIIRRETIDSIKVNNELTAIETAIIPFLVIIINTNYTPFDRLNRVYKKIRKAVRKIAKTIPCIIIYRDYSANYICSLHQGKKAWDLTGVTKSIFLKYIRKINSGGCIMDEELYDYNVYRISDIPTRIVDLYAKNENKEMKLYAIYKGLDTDDVYSALRKRLVYIKDPVCICSITTKINEWEIRETFLLVDSKKCKKYEYLISDSISFIGNFFTI